MIAQHSEENLWAVGSDNGTQVLRLEEQTEIVETLVQRPLFLGSEPSSGAASQLLPEDFAKSRVISRPEFTPDRVLLQESLLAKMRSFLCRIAPWVYILVGYFTGNPIILFAPLCVITVVAICLLVQIIRQACSLSKFAEQSKAKKVNRDVEGVALLESGSTLSLELPAHIG